MHDIPCRFRPLKSYTKVNFFFKTLISFFTVQSSLRIHGDNKRSDIEILARDNLVTAFISDLKQGPHLYGVFDLGRIEQYFPVNIKASVYQ